MHVKSRKDTSVFTQLEAQAEVATKGAETFLAMAKDFSNLPRYAEELDLLESEGDRITHELQNRIVATFITPLDKEDLKELSSALDDVLDYTEAAAARAALYRLTGPRKELVPLSELLVKSTRLVQSVVATLRGGVGKSKELESMLMEIHTVENASDKMFRMALGNLFDEPGIEALTVIKWKEMFDRIETAIDKCEHIAAIIGTILVKYA